MGIRIRRKAESQWGTTEAWGWGTQGTEEATVMSLEGEGEQGVKGSQTTWQPLMGCMGSPGNA